MPRASARGCLPGSSSRSHPSGKWAEASAHPHRGIRARLRAAHRAAERGTAARERDTSGVRALSSPWPGAGGRRASVCGAALDRGPRARSHGPSRGGRTAGCARRGERQCLRPHGGEGYGMQLGAFGTPASADREWQRLQERFGPQLGGLSPRIVLASTTAVPSTVCRRRRAGRRRRARSAMR